MNEVVACLATIPSRKKELRLVCEGLLPQVDRLFIYFNNYKESEVPLWAKSIDKVEYETSLDGQYGDLGDVGKFYFCSEEMKDKYGINGLVFTCDDDIVYPDWYVSRTVSLIKDQYEGEVLSYHGSIINNKNRNYHRGGIVKSFKVADSVEGFNRVNVGGTGCMCFNVNTFRPSLKMFQFTNMSDIFIARLCNESRINITVVPHLKGDFKILPVADTIWRNSARRTRTARDRSRQVSHILSSVTWNDCSKVSIKEPGRVRILFITAMWKRRKIEEVTFSHLSRLKDNVSDRALLSFLAVGSEGSDSRQMAEKHGWDYIEHKNDPLGSKWNALWNQAITYDVDVIVIIGSDNIVPLDAVNYYIKFSESSHGFMGMKGTYMLNPLDDDALSFDGYKGARSGEPVGGGRAFSRDAFRKIGPNPFQPNINKGLDGSFYRSMNKRVPRTTRWVIEPLSKSQVFELKSNVQLWSIEDFRKGRDLYTEMTFDKCLSLIGDPLTRKAISALA